MLHECNSTMLEECPWIERCFEHVSKSISSLDFVEVIWIDAIKTLMNYQPYLCLVLMLCFHILASTFCRISEGSLLSINCTSLLIMLSKSSSCRNLWNCSEWSKELELCLVVYKMNWFRQQSLKGEVIKNDPSPWKSVENFCFALQIPRAPQSWEHHVESCRGSYCWYVLSSANKSFFENLSSWNGGIASLFNMACGIKSWLLIFFVYPPVSCNMQPVINFITFCVWFKYIWL